MLPSVAETPLQVIKCGCSMSVCETSRCKYKVNHLYCTDLCCRGAEEESCKIFPVVNMLMTFEQLFSCGYRYFFSRINKNALLSDFEIEDDSTYKHAKDKSDCNSFLFALLSKYNG